MLITGSHRQRACLIGIAGTRQHFAKATQYVDELRQIARCGAVMLCND